MKTRSRLGQVARVAATMALVATALGASACRDANGGGDDDDGSGADGGPTGGDGGVSGASIYDIQSGKIGEGQLVTVANVVVTAIDNYGGFVGAFWVQDEKGGPHSGILVAKTSLPSGVVVGDLVTLAGAVVDEDAYKDDMSGRKVTRLVPADGAKITVTKIGTGQVPAPAIVDAALLAGSDAEAEKWEGVLIKLENVTVVAAPKGVSMNDPLLKAAKVTGPFEVSSGLTALSVGGTELKSDECLASVTGIVDYFLQFKLLPRSEADIVKGGGACPAKESGQAACSDTVDNDHNGFSDCDDFSCQAVPGLDCSVTGPIADVQKGAIGQGKQVNLSQVVITAIDVAKDEDRVWVADAAQAAPYAGIVVYKPAGGVSGLAIGDVVDVRGWVTEFYGLTQIADSSTKEPPTITKKSGTAPPVPVVVAASALAEATMAEPYEGVLLKLENVKVTSLNPDAAGGTNCTMNDCGEYMVTGGAANVRVDNLIVQTRTGKALGDCLSVTGVLTYDFGKFKLLPRADADVVAGAGCP